MDLPPRRRARGHPWLDLRDGVTALIVEGLCDDEAAAALETLGAHVSTVLGRGSGGPGDAEQDRREGGRWLPGSGTARQGLGTGARESAMLPPTAPGARRLREAGLVDDEGRLHPEAYRHLAYLHDRCARAARARVGLLAAQPAELAGVAAELLAYVWLVRAGLHFEAHDCLEARWGRARGSDRLFYQALIQIAVALQHFANGNGAGAASLLETALEKLEPLGATRGGLDLERLRDGTRRALGALRAGAAYDPALVPPLVAARRA